MNDFLQIKQTRSDFLMVRVHVLYGNLVQYVVIMRTQDTRNIRYSNT